MPDTLMNLSPSLLAEWDLIGILKMTWYVILMLIGFSVVIFVHELGHFAVAKWVGVRVERFAIGFGRELFGFTHGETRYSFNILPLGGYVKMLGQEDFVVDKSGEWAVKADPRSFTHKPVGHRAAIVSAGVIMNVLFAAMLFMLVFMVGKDVVDNVIGQVLPGTPADAAGLRSGDRVVTIDGQDIDEFIDLKMAVVLADPGEPLDFTIERDGKVQTLQVTPKFDKNENVQQVGIGNASTNKLRLAGVQPGIPDEKQLKREDRIIRVGEFDDPDIFDVGLILLDARGKPVTVRVERPDPNDPDTLHEVDCLRRGRLFFVPTGDPRTETGHVLGLMPRRAIANIEPGSRAELAGAANPEDVGFELGDVVLAWGGISSPTFQECYESIQNNEERDIRVRVRRGDRELDLTVRPKADRNGLRKGRPMVGVSFMGQEDDRVVVAETVDAVDGVPTPASALRLPRGSEIVAVDGEPVHDWYGLVDAFRAKAGRSVEIGYKYGDEPVRTGSMQIPGSLSTDLRDADGKPVDLPLSAVVLSVAGQQKVTARDAENNEKPFSVGGDRGLREALRAHIGETVEIGYRDRLTDEEKTAWMAVTADNIDPWARRVIYEPGMLAAYPLIKKLQKSNPLEAMIVGGKKTYYFIAQAYMTMKAMLVTKTVGVEHVSGPVGIVKIGASAAEAGMLTLLYFLAMLSANLAVINFLPIPIDDGGLMVFLIIEKIKGKPISLKMQVATQIIGLALIISIFIYVTINDILKFL